MSAVHHFRSPLLIGAALVAMLVGSFFWPLPAQAKTIRIAVWLSYDQPPFEQALTGLQQALQKEGVEAEFHIERLQGVAENKEPAIQRVRQKKADLVVAFGSLALEAATSATLDRPIVAGMVMGKIQGIANLTGVSLEISPREQFVWLKRFLPKAATIGVIYNPAENSKLVEEAALVAATLGLRLEKREISSPGQLLPALDGMANSIDVLWGISDAVVLNQQTAKGVLLFSFRNRIPFVGLSEGWVKAGALYALDRDYQDLGRQCGEMAVRLIRGERPEVIPPEGPRRIIYSVNLKTAEQMKLDLPSPLVQKAAQTY